MSKYELELTHYDYDEKETVSDGAVSIRDIARALDPETLAELLDDYVNNFSSGYKRGRKTGHALRSHHRTLQRSVITELIGVISGLSEQEYTDPRNEKAIELAKKVKALYEEYGAGGMV